LLRRKVEVFWALIIHWMLPSNLWFSGFYLQFFVFTHMSPQSHRFPRCNLGERENTGLREAARMRWGSSRCVR
jgi:hypothetical protein